MKEDMAGAGLDASILPASVLETQGRATDSFPELAPFAKVLERLSQDVQSCIESSRLFHPNQMGRLLVIEGVKEAGFKDTTIKLDYVTLENNMFMSETSRSRVTHPTSHKTVVVSGESGAGKTYFALNQLLDDLFTSRRRDNPADLHPMVFYFCLSDYEDFDSDTREDETMEKSARNTKAFTKLKEFWEMARRKIIQKFPAMQEAVGREHWRKLQVVLVLDELGNKPNLVRGLVAAIPEFEKLVTKTESSGYNAPVHDFRAALVGTAIDWALIKSHDDPKNIACASNLNFYVHIAIQPWCREKLKEYLQNRLRAHDTTRELADSTAHAVLSIPLLELLGRNARCASFLARHVIQLLSTLNVDAEFNGMPTTAAIQRAKATIFRQVALNYLEVNGIHYMMSRMGGHQFSAYAIQSLRFVGHKLIDDQVKREEDEVRCLLIYGILHLSPDRVDGQLSLQISAALLLLILHGFGWRDMPVADPESFAQIVALREMANIIIEDKDAKVDFVVLSEPVPARNIIKRKKNAISFSLPAHAFPPRQDGGALADVREGHVLIVVNGPKAPTADVIVIYKDKLKLIQAKRYSTTGNDNSSGNSRWKKEMRKLGLRVPEVSTRKRYPATCAFLLSLASLNAGGNRSVERVVVTAAAHGFLQQDEKTYTYDDAILGGKARVSCTEIEPVWRQLVLDPQVESYKERKFHVPDLNDFLKGLPVFEEDSKDDVEDGDDDDDDDDDDDADDDG